jgi:peptidoglycan-associated lipoprotein
MRLKQLVSLLAAVVLLAACESAGSGSGTQAGSGGQAGAGAGAGQEALAAMLSRAGDRVFFDYDRSDLQPAARTTIQSWASWLKVNGGASVVVQGHADERGTREYNLALGDRRASAVKNYLVALGVAAGRVRNVSYGKERPQDPGHNESAWAQNRRGVLVSQ